MRPPGFWARDGALPRSLSPLSAVTAAITARRVARPGVGIGVPVICCGGVTAGGAGKTTLALDLGRRLLARGVRLHFLTRGYGGRERGPLRVDPALHDAAWVGDEALLLAALAPCWVSRDRAAGGRAATEAGAMAVVMDDGLQNPGLRQDLALMVVDGATGFGNGRVMPAGPLREPVSAGAARVRAAVLIGDDLAGAARSLPPGLPVLRARLVPGPEATALAGCRVLAMAGIAFPGKFHRGLREAGALLAGQADFPDHHRFTPAELDRVLDRARQLEAMPVTTPKDAVRLPPAWRDRFRVVGTSLAWTDPGSLEALLAGTVP